MSKLGHMLAGKTDEEVETARLVMLQNNVDWVITDLIPRLMQEYNSGNAFAKEQLARLFDALSTLDI